MKPLICDVSNLNYILCKQNGTLQQTLVTVSFLYSKFERNRNEL